MACRYIGMYRIDGSSVQIGKANLGHDIPTIWCSTATSYKVILPFIFSSLFLLLTTVGDSMVHFMYRMKRMINITIK